jgi:hypothetical protein
MRARYTSDLPLNWYLSPLPSSTMRCRIHFMLRFPTNHTLSFFYSILCFLTNHPLSFFHFILRFLTNHPLSFFRFALCYYPFTYSTTHSFKLYSALPLVHPYRCYHCHPCHFFGFPCRPFAYSTTDSFKLCSALPLVHSYCCYYWHYDEIHTFLDIRVGRSEERVSR